MLNNQTKFSKISLVSSLITMALFLNLILPMPKTIKASEVIAQPSIILVVAIEIFCLSGIIMTGLSFMKKEPSTWFQWVGGGLNILLFIIIFGSIIFARTV
ncbi:hypothetical protein QWY85_04280 [Neolewinella lacunae]|uniref:Uncharacterized protein n=1 Tax=Neolewinella lacunae TaxID=1517758 RepID=A0A923PJF1_9BACT|nr:hypothetical protein [Neolewinella lacunae]MBC6992836.1 hypothetical protein [Neolewinella lacunae]MDN3633863.1 hypothetical protein [Neolewinella lacunae]